MLCLMLPTNIEFLSHDLVMPLILDQSRKKKRVISLHHGYLMLQTLGFYSIESIIK